MQNFIKTIINGVQKWTKKEIKKSTADWNQNDENAADYVKNRTHWAEASVVTTILPKFECKSNAHSAYKGQIGYISAPFVIDGHYTVVFDGTVYDCVAYEFEDQVCLGNMLYLYDDVPINYNIPFLITSQFDSDGDWYTHYRTNEAGHTFEVIEIQENIHKLDSKYLDLPTNLATTDDVQEAVDVANEAWTTADGKMDKNNPVGTGSFSMNRKSGTTVGTNSHAEGYDTTASGSYSHAEGNCSIASGLGAHAEGIGTTSYPSRASGPAAHSEGQSCEASGAMSHAEGNYTIAASGSQHAQGKFNKKDENHKYAHIVGNGTSDTKRSNAHTLDWNGVGWYQGGLQVGGNAQDDGAKNVLLEGDAIPIPENATVGQTIAVKSVDENGKPVEWEAADFSSSGGSGCIVSDIAPEDTSVLWIDTADNSDDTLQDAVNIALAQAKESGEFKGDPGKTPEKGVDYYTDTDKTELINAVLSALPAWTGGSY